MTYTFFDPSQVNELAKFQGGFSGALAGNAAHIGVAQAPTSVFNQSGYYALQDSDTGYLTLKKLGNESLYTGEWYDQSTKQVFDFKEDKSVFDLSNLTGNMSAAQIAGLDN